MKIDKERKIILRLDEKKDAMLALAVFGDIIFKAIDDRLEVDQDVMKLRELVKEYPEGIRNEFIKTLEPHLKKIMHQPYGFWEDMLVKGRAIYKNPYAIIKGLKKELRHLENDLKYRYIYAISVFKPIKNEEEMNVYRNTVRNTLIKILILIITVLSIVVSVRLMKTNILY